MLIPRTNLARRVTSALDATPSRIPVLLGGCGSGRTTLLMQLRDRLGRSTAQYIDVERTATTPERFLRAILSTSPFPPAAGATPPIGARPSFDATLEFLTRPHPGSGAPVTFLLDEFLELRTFESFPGLRSVQHELIDGLAASGNRFVLSSRYSARAMRLLRDRPARFEVIQMPTLGADDALEMIAAADPSRRQHADPDGHPVVRGEQTEHDAHERDFLARTIVALTDGRPTYVRALIDQLSAITEQGAPGGGDAISALVGLLAPEAKLGRLCGFSYELRLHRARGYGALKAILDILAEEEGLTLTEISHRLQRTPGSTKDYLSWLEDVDLVTSRQKRYSFTDPLLRLWVRLHCRATAPTEEDLAQEVHRYALPRLPQPTDAPTPPKQKTAEEPMYAMAGSTSSGIIEID